MITQRRDRRDWTLLIFIIPIAVILMCIAGQLAIRILPRWSVPAGMESNLDPNAPAQPFSIFQPILPQILTPIGWADIYLTPGLEIVFPPFFIFTPPGASATPLPATPTPTGTPTASPPPSQTGTIVPPLPTRTPTRVFSPGPNPTSTNTPPPPFATATRTATVTRTSTSTTTVTATVTATVIQPPTATPTGNPSTPPPGYIPVLPPPWDPIRPPATPHLNLPQGQYTVIDISSNPIVLDDSGNWYLIFYERASTDPPFSMVDPGIFLDNIILGISKEPDGSVYYKVFDWGNISGLPTDDLNTNLVGTIEVDNAEIFLTDLYPYPGTGIVINIKGAASQPPPGTYNYLVIIAPTKSGMDTIEITGIEIIFVP